MQTIDNVVSAEKFRHELDICFSGKETQRKRGVLLLKAEYPDIILLFTAPVLKPSAIVFAVKVNFDNYDLEALSVRFIDPFTWEYLDIAPTPLLRKIPPYGPTNIQPLAIKDQVGLPFICIPGIREYHNHPAHTGDSWLLHRQKGGEGTLGFIIDKLFEYGISAINTYQFQLQGVVQIPQLILIYDQNLIPK